MDDVFDWLQEWYLAHCDGKWEHHHGIDIESLDNPGWRVIVSIAGTELNDRPFEARRERRSEHDWIDCKVADSPKGGTLSFVAGGGPRNLRELLEAFRGWATD